MIDQRLVQQDLSRRGNISFGVEYMNKYIDEMDLIVSKAEKVAQKMVEIANQTNNPKTKKLYGDIYTNVKQLRKSIEVIFRMM